MPPRDDAPRDLLFGLLALQNGLVTRDQLVAAVGAWTGAPGRALADLLVEQGALDTAGRDLLLALADRHLQAHGGDPERSLAALALNRSDRDGLAAAGGPDVEATLAHVGSGSTDPDADHTATYSVGAATADGQRFRVLRPHAQGGLGAVFVALDAELNREVALKQILDRHADDPVSRQRFLVEAQVTGGLEHPGIVPVYGLGTYGGGRPYYAMRFIKGDSLKDTVARFHADPTLKADPGRRSLELRKLLRRFLDVCNAIGYAHSRGVLHRDIKPGNVIIGRHGETLVVDWGLAKVVGRDAPDPMADERTLRPPSASGSSGTLRGEALGTPAYMSPEQARGDLEALGPRSDVYSLGATLYCLLTGKPPFERDDPGEVLRRVQAGDFPPPRQVDSSIDRALEAVCLRALATRPDDRYPSPRALAEDVERWAADEPVSAWREPLSGRTRRWTRRHRTAVAAAAVALLAGVVGLAALAGVQSRANRRLQNEKDQTARALTAESKAKRETQAALAESQASRKLAMAQARIATSRQLAALSASERGRRLDRSLLLAVEAVRLGDTVEARESLFNALQDRPHLASLLDLREGRVTSVAFDPGGKTIAAGFVVGGVVGGVGGVVLFDVATRRRLADEPLTVNEGGVQSVAFDPGGKTIAAGYYTAGVGVGGGVVLFDADSRRRLTDEPLAVKEGVVTSVAFGPGGKTIAAGYYSGGFGGGGGVVLFDADSRRRLTDEPLAVKEGGVISVAFDPGGKTIAAGYHDRGGGGGVVLFNIDLESWQRIAGRIANRNFTRDEWRQYFPDEPYRSTFPEFQVSPEAPGG
jgi:serine/threonine protein kinase